MTTRYMWLTNIGSFWIISIYIGHSAGIAGIIENLWNIKSIPVTNLFWVITWSPSVSWWRVPFCFTVKSYTLLYTNNILRLKFNNLGWICTSNWKIGLKNSIYTNIHLSDLIVFNSYTVRDPTLNQYTYIQEGILCLVWCF